MKLDIWDTPGDTAVANITANFLKGAHAIIVVYSIDRPSSFKNVSNWIEAAEKNCPANTCIVICGNKCDLDNDRRVKMEELEEKADEHSTSLKFETSAMMGYRETIDAMFT